MLIDLQFSCQKRPWKETTVKLHFQLRQCRHSGAVRCCERLLHISTLGGWAHHRGIVFESERKGRNQPQRNSFGWVSRGIISWDDCRSARIQSRDLGIREGKPDFCIDSPTLFSTALFGFYHIMKKRNRKIHNLPFQLPELKKKKA